MQVNYQNFIYNDEKGYIFAYVPKVACTNWKALLRYMAGADDWLDNRLAHDKSAGGLHYLSLGGADAALLDRAGIRKFTMVRAPYTRVLSAYLNKIERYLPVGEVVEGEDYFIRITRAIDQYRIQHLEAEDYPEINFEVFLLWLMNVAKARDQQVHFRADEHWAPQSVLLRQPGVSFDFIGRFESLETDAAKILSEIGCDKSFPSHKDVKFPPTNAEAKTFSYYTGRCIALVNEIYDADFRIFGYEKTEAPTFFLRLKEGDASQG